jgi:hypothetical protein
MSLFIQSGNALVSRVSQWVGAISQSISINATALDTTGQIITTSANATSQVSIGDFIGWRIQGPFTLVIGVTSTTITVNDPDGYWADASFPVDIRKLPTQASFDIQMCVQNAELKMRTCELPFLRSNPYDINNPSFLLTDENGMAPIPEDMNWPILFFQETPNTDVQPETPAASLGPWIVYDRVSDREIIRRRMIDQLYVRPFGVPRVIRASFSEVGQKYVFTPNPGKNVRILAYYQQTFAFLFTASNDVLNPIFQSNAVLETFPEGYLYGTLWAYYDKTKNTGESQKWLSRFDDAYGLIEDQNFKDKWRGGDRHLTSEYQPRNYRYSFK